MLGLSDFESDGDGAFLAFTGIFGGWTIINKSGLAVFCAVVVAG